MDSTNPGTGSNPEPSSRPGPGAGTNASAGSSTGSPGAPPAAQGGGGKDGLSTGAKVAIGCGGVTFLGIAVVAVGGYLAAGWLGDQAEEFVGDFAEQAERQQEADEIMERVQEQYAFERPEDGVVREDQAQTFFAVTDDLWAEMGPWAEELQTVADRVEEEDEASISDLMASIEGAGRFAEGRAIFAETLETHGMAPDEYVWTGFSLVRAHEELDDDEDRVVPEGNVEMARAFDAEIQALSDPPEDGNVAPGMLLSTAMVWGWTHGAAMDGMGIDTIYPEEVP